MKDDRSSTAAEAGASAVPSPSSETLTERQRRVLEV
ncbi:MAG: LexA repressor, partial [Rhodococcus erythropolis]|nr:LexA repressor [Rhodococcus erythropolis]